MATPIAIFGAGGFGREVLQVILDINENFEQSPPWLPVGFVVDEGYDAEGTIHGLPVYVGSSWLEQHSDVQVIIAVGSSAGRKKIAERIAGYGNTFATLVHPRAWVGRNVNVGIGSVICAGALVTTDITISEHVHVNIGSTIGHDAVLSGYVTLNPSVNISGNASLATGVEVGTGSVVIPNVNIGEWSIVGAGSIVTKSLEPNVTAVGVPAKVIKVRASGWFEA